MLKTFVGAAIGALALAWLLSINTRQANLIEIRPDGSLTRGRR